MIFVDTAFIVALLDPLDRLHAGALELLQTLHKKRSSLVTTDAVLIETGNFFARSPLRSESIHWIQAIRENSQWETVPLTAGLLASGEARYRRFTDKTWSLTDCISMEAMKERRIHRVATTDHHFEQAGFEILLKAT